MDSAIALYILVGLISVLLLAGRRSGKALRAIPTVGPSAPLVSYIGALRFFRDAKGMLQEGYDKYRGSVFKVALLDQWLVVITGPKLIDELRKLPDDQVSFIKALDEQLQTKYTLGADVSNDPYHTEIIRGQLTRNLGALMPDVIDEIEQAFSDCIPVKDNEWVEVSVITTMQQIIARASNRVFVGLPKCRDTDYLNLAIDFTINVAMGQTVINLFPPVLRPIAGPLFSGLGKATKRMTEHLKPMMDERRKKQIEYGEEWPDKPRDMLTWLMDEAQVNNRSDESLVRRILVVCFAAIHTSSNSITHALYHLAANPELLQPLRDEVMYVVNTYGWNKASVGRMWKLDSFLKESQRMNGIDGTSITRKAMQDVTLSDGTFIPVGTRIVAAAAPTHRDDEHYTNAGVFDPFRFSNMRGEEGESTKHQYVSTAPDYISFGHGRHACPGRFFAASELKAMLAYVVLNYDVKFERKGERPVNVWIGTMIVPAPSAKVMFRKRQATTLDK